MIKKGRGKIPNKGNMRMKDQRKQASSGLCPSQVSLVQGKLQLKFHGFIDV